MPSVSSLNLDKFVGRTPDRLTLDEREALVGYYMMVAMTLNAHEMMLPDATAGIGRPLPAVGDGLTACAGAPACGPMPAGAPRA